MGGYHAMEVNYDVQYKLHGREVAVGSGATAEVRPCTDNRTHALRAVKSIKKATWNTRRHILEEIEMLKAVAGKHPNVIEYFEFYEEWSVINLIFEYCPKGSIEQAIAKQTLRGGDSEAAHFVCQLLDALKFLRDNFILHRDVKPANILLADTRRLKLADFGVACYCTEPLWSREGTPAFFPPEVHQLPRGVGYSFPMDVWATGVTMYMLLFAGKHPFEEQSIINKELLRSGEFEVGWLTSSKAKDLLEWLLMPYPDQRITSNEALHHAWFASHGLGGGGFSKERPHKLILDSHGNWLLSN
mmetsp:Transcript_15859/g.37083  ORF Transcript_15859/g.37083 Transcript_15859/m.37083 type:complete len:301 (-) Transcript_15859:51-953(-)